MTAGLRHPDWYRVSDQVFRQRAGLHMVHQTFRGGVFLVISDRITGQHLRLSNRAASFWRHLDGRATVHDVWRSLSASPGSAPSQSEIVGWLLQLVSAGLVVSDHPLDPEALTDRGAQSREKQLDARTLSPLAVRIPLFDPSRLIGWLYPVFGWFFGPLGVWLLGLLLCAGSASAALHSSELGGLTDRAFLSQESLLSLALVFPVMKVVHELAHGLAVQRFGGAVREFGVMLLVFFPVPYVDATEANVLPDKEARMIVGAAGILAELAMAAIALLIWLQLEPGLLRALLFNVMLIATVSTLFFNGNPLLKFDAYFVLADWFEIPNLAQRGGELVADIFLARLLGLRREVFARPGEAKVLVVYHLVSLAYRMALSVAIALLVSRSFFVLGVLLAVWALLLGVGWPLFKMARKGKQMAHRQNRRGRALGRLSVIGAMIGLVLFAVPVPFTAIGRGTVVTLPEARLPVDAAGRVSSDVTSDGETVARGDVVLRLENADIAASLATVSHRISYLKERLSRAGLNVTERREAEQTLALAKRMEAALETRRTALEIRAPSAGVLRWNGGAAPRSGTYLYRGDDVGRVVAPRTLEVLVSFPAGFAGQLPDDARGVTLLLPNGVTVEEEIASASVIDAGQQAPLALLASAGGPIPVRPEAPDQALVSALVVRIFPIFDLTAHESVRVSAKIALPPAPLSEQLAFHIRRLFLRVIRV